MSITIRRLVPHLIPLAMSKEVSIELSESQEKPAEELNHHNDTDRESSQNSGC